MATNPNNANGGAAKGRSFRVVGVLAVVVLVGAAVVWLRVVRAAEDPAAEYATFVAQQGPLTISVLETGTIKAREQIILKNEVEGRTSIIFLIEEGTRVEEGELLVELDASAMEDARIDQEISVQNADAAYINARESLAVVKNQAQSDKELAELTLRFARQDLQNYVEGIYPNELTAAENRVQEAEEVLVRAKETLRWSETLFSEKYISETELMGDRLNVTRNENSLTVAGNELKLLEEFTYYRNIEQYNSDVNQAVMALERTLAKNSADIAQAEAALTAKELEFRRQKDKMTKIVDQLSKTKVTAPAAGMVIYATSARGSWRGNQEPLDEGQEIHERQELIYLPTTASSMADVDVHEASLEKVRLGLPAIVTVDALPGQKFIGTVGRIAPLPDPQSMWMNPDLKVYESEIWLEGNNDALRTGMSCKADIIVEQYEDAVYIPVQAVLRVRGKPTVYVVKDGVVEERQVEIGLDNNRMIKIDSGIEAGEVVLLTPPLSSATLDAEAELAGSGLGGAGATEASGTMKEQISERLRKANGTTPGAGPAGPGQGPAGGRQGPGGLPGGQGLSPEQTRRMRERFENMTPEQKKAMEEMRKRIESMTPEEREKMRQRFQQQGGGRPGGRQGPGGGGGPRQGPGGGGGQRPDGAGRGGRTQPRGEGGGQ
jgi:HlyD family secretion protein